MKRSASEVLRDLEIRVANLEKLARPSMSPRRQIEEGLLDYEGADERPVFRYFDLTPHSIEKFIKRKMIENGELYDDGKDKITFVEVDSFDKGKFNFNVRIINESVLRFSDGSEATNYYSLSFDVEVRANGKVSNIIRGEEQDLTKSQFYRQFRRPADVEIDLVSIERSFPHLIFNTTLSSNLQKHFRRQLEKHSYRLLN